MAKKKVTRTRPKQAASPRALDYYQKDVQEALDALGISLPAKAQEVLQALLAKMQRAEKK